MKKIAHTPQAAIYVRISRDREGAGLGVSRQQKDCEALADSLGWPVCDVYVDNDISAFSGRVRPRYREMLEDIRSGKVQAVLAWHTDRLHRSPLELEEYLDLGIQTVTVKAGELDLATPSGRAVARTLGAWARYESEHKSQRLSRKYQEMAEAGIPRGAGRRPFGYEQDGMTVRVHEAAEIRSMTDRVIAGDTLASIMRDLNERGVLTVGGREWKYPNLRAVLLRPRNAGLMQYQGEIIGDASWPAVVSKTSFYTCKAILENPGRRTTTTSARVHLLPGIAKCGVCGNGMKWGSATDRTGTKNKVYRCCVYRNEARLDALISRLTILCLTSPAVRKTLAPKSKRAGRDQTVERADIQGRMNQAAEAFGSRSITMAQFTTANELLQARLFELDEDLVSSATAQPWQALPSNADVADAWNLLTLARKRAVIDSLFEIEVLPVGRGNKGKDFHKGIRVTLKGQNGESGNIIDGWLDYLSPAVAVRKYAGSVQADKLVTAAQRQAIARAFG